MILPLLADGRVLAGFLSGPQTYIYNPATNTCAGFVGLSHNPVSLAFDGTNLWVANLGSDTVDRVRP